MTWGAVAVAGATVVGGAIQAGATKDASNTAAAGQAAAGALSDAQFQQTRSDYQPYLDVATGTKVAYDNASNAGLTAAEDFIRTLKGNPDQYAKLPEEYKSNPQALLEAARNGAFDVGYGDFGRNFSVAAADSYTEMSKYDPNNLTGGALNQLSAYGDSKVLQGDYIPASNQPQYNQVDLNSDPSYQFRVSEQENALNRNMASAGKVTSGNRLDAIMKQSGEMASQEYAAADARNRADFSIAQGQENIDYSRGVDAYGRAVATEDANLNRLASLSNVGQTATQNVATLGANNAANAGNAAIGAANATAAGTIGTANANVDMVNGLTQAYGAYNASQPQITQQQAMLNEQW